MIWISTPDQSEIKEELHIVIFETGSPSTGH